RRLRRCLVSADHGSTVRRYYEQAPGNDAVIGELFSTDYAFHAEDSPITLGDSELFYLHALCTYDPPDPGRVKLRALYARLHVSFPDWTYAVDDVITQDDRVAARVTGRGVHKV